MCATSILFSIHFFFYSKVPEMSMKLPISPKHHKFSLSSFYPQKKLCLESQIQLVLKLFCIIGIDLAHKRKSEGVKKIIVVLQLYYRWLMCLLMIYFFVARVYKAAQPNTPLMLSFSETAATGCSILLRFVLLSKRMAFNKFLKSIHFIQTSEEVSSPSSYVRREKFFLAFSFGGFLLTMAMSTAKALAELLSEQGFETYKKSYLFSAQFKNDSLLYKLGNIAVFASHLMYIINLYSVPSLCILFCCFACNGISFFNSSFKTKLDEYSYITEWRPKFVQACICHLRRMHSIVDRAESAISTVLFFLFGYLLCSLFYIVSITISKYNINVLNMLFIFAANSLQANVNILRDIGCVTLNH